MDEDTDAIIADLKNRLDQAESFIRVQEYEIDMKVQDQLDATLRDEYNRGRRDSSHLAQTATVVDAMCRAINARIAEELPDMIRSAVPDEYRDMFPKPMQTFAPTVHTAIRNDPDPSNTTTYTTEIVFPARVLKMHYRADYGF